MNKLLLPCILILIFSQSSFAQTQDTIRTELPFKLSKRNNELVVQPLPYYNFGKGVGITSSDSLFQLNIRFRIQNRLEYFQDENEESLVNASIRRLRLRFDGYVGNPNFLYVIQLSFAPGDVGEIEEGSNLNIIRDAMVFYQPSKTWGIGFGQTKLPGNRQRVNSSGALQLTDRSINNAYFTIDRDFGLQGYYLSNLHSKPQFNLRAAVTTGEGRNYTKFKNTGLAYTGRAEVFLFGRFSRQGEFFEGDLFRENTPKVMIGATYHYNNNALRTGGQLGKNLFTPKDYTTTFIDFIGKYNGTALMYSYMNRSAPDPISYDPNNPTNFNFIGVGSGHDFQASYLLKYNYELIGRYSTQKAGAKIASFVPDQKQYTFGITKYIWEHAFKLQTDVSFTEYEYFDNSKKNNWFWRFQVEMGI